MKWFIIAGFVLAGLCIFVWWGTKPIYYRNQGSDSFLPFTESLFSQGGHGSLLFIHHADTERFVQFAKYISPKRTVHFGFPGAQ